jgi:hypothetical protein
MPTVFRSLGATSFCWFIASSLWVYPHSLSYFNESIGGPLYGPKCLLGSNCDWGQDLLYLRRFTEDHDCHCLGLAYFGLFSPSDVGFRDVLACGNDSLNEEQSQNSSSQNSSPHVEFLLRAISVNFLYRVRDAVPFAAFQGNLVDDRILTRIRSEEPIGRAGYSIMLFSAPREPDVD